MGFDSDLGDHPGIDMYDYTFHVFRVTTHERPGALSLNMGKQRLSCRGNPPTQEDFKKALKNCLLAVTKDSSKCGKYIVTWKHEEQAAALIIDVEKEEPLPPPLTFTVG